MSAEFNLIKQYFTRPTAHTDLGIGDDAALIQTSAGHQLAISSDMSVVGTHFFEDAAPYDIGWKSLAVNISDMAAMGAKPRWATLSIALPDINTDWLSAFSAGFFSCANASNVDLIGGDTTRGPLNISVTILGEVPIGKALKRSDAQVGDDIWVSGYLGHAALGLAHLQQKIVLDGDTRDFALSALHQPQPRVSVGLALRELAHSCIDVSDGLLADLSHILKASSSNLNDAVLIGATLQLEKMPCLSALKNRLQESTIQQAILTGGDDYELCFTASPKHRETITILAESLNVNLTRIGETNATGKLTVQFAQQNLNMTALGYDHFA
ncbi:MAG: thiamine-phosphate kinase [Betaproteobacteria bacterium]|nr:thiamine-phosphate kinase [Betaproteobacteria bacterium]MCH9848387.1 thiamine-phosphate kinase [Betaproteobacteria bacterium]